MADQDFPYASDDYQDAPPPPYEAIWNHAAPTPLSIPQQRYQSEQHPRPNSLRDVNAGTSTRSVDQGAALCDRVASQLNDILCSLERESPQPEGYLAVTHADFDDGRQHPRNATNQSNRVARQPDGGFLSFKKTWMYANSRLAPQMLPFKVYVPTWSILCRAADASVAVYNRPKGNERQEYIDADWRHGTKAMALKSICLDEKNLIVFAIRGSKWNLFDWATNFRPAPTEPVGFLDDLGNACHAGFLHVARAMVRPVAARLRQLLEQDPGRAGSSLVLTGHSAGGAVASLLYMHMMSNLIESELNILAGCFRRVHCVTFGAPPVSLLPLRNPNNARNKKNIFIAFANEGDPVVRADKHYITSLCHLIAAPAPIVESSSQRFRSKASHQKSKRNMESSAQAPWWPVTDATLSNAGRIVLLRKKPAGKQTTEAVCVTDQELRNVIFGDPSMHDMALYRQRVEELAIAAVTGHS